jgi:AraC-like DNA-binding protein
MLHLMAMIFGDAAPQGGPVRSAVPATLIRFEEVIARISDSELMHCPSEKLAELCGCSVRHFRRVFRSHFKTSVRAKQTALRLEKACQLLVETEEKIVSIAFESGYRHLGFFNAVFKKKFGVTPSEWRRQHSLSAKHGPNGHAAARQ